MQPRTTPITDTANLTETSDKPTKRYLEALVRTLRRKHLRFDQLACSGCVARARREYAKEERITMIESTLVEHGIADVIRVAFPALVPLIQRELEMIINGPATDEPDF